MEVQRILVLSIFLLFTSQYGTANNLGQEVSLRSLGVRKNTLNQQQSVKRVFGSSRFEAKRHSDWLLKIFGDKRRPSSTQLSNFVDTESNFMKEMPILSMSARKKLWIKKVFGTYRMDRNHASKRSQQNHDIGFLQGILSKLGDKRSQLNTPVASDIGNYPIADQNLPQDEIRQLPAAMLYDVDQSSLGEDNPISSDHLFIIKLEFIDNNEDTTDAKSGDWVHDLYKLNKVGSDEKEYELNLSHSGLDGFAEPLKTEKRSHSVFGPPRLMD